MEVLKGYLWLDVHHALANQIRRRLTPKLHPRYAARLEVYVVEDSFPESEIAKVMDVWPLTLQDALPIIPIPLKSPNPDVPLDLSTVLSEVYDEAAYDLSLNYASLHPHLFSRGKIGNGWKS